MADDKKTEKEVKATEEELRKSIEKSSKDSEPGPNYQATQSSSDAMIMPQATITPKNAAEDDPLIRNFPADDYTGVPKGAQLGAPQLQMQGISQPQLQMPAPTNPQTTPPMGAPQLQQPGAMVPPNAQLPTPYGNGIPSGAIGATPQQYQQAGLNMNQRQQDLAVQNAQDLADATQKTVDIQNQAAAEKQQQNADFQNHLLSSTQEHQERERATKAAYDKWVAETKNMGQDPSKTFWKDRSVPSKILSGLALFSSGLGAGLQHKGGNPYLDFLNNEIARNFDAHKDAIGQLYQQQVAAGKMADTSDNYNKFMADAKLTGYGLAAQHITAQLEAVKAQTTGQAQVNEANKAILGLQQTADNAKSSYTQQLAAKSAAQLALQRQQIKEARATYNSLYDKNLTAGYGADEAAANAAEALQKSGLDRSIIGSIMTGNGYSYDMKSAKWAAPAKVGGAASSDELVPTKDPATGKLLKPEEREKLTQLEVDTHMGKRLANSTEDKTYIQKANLTNAAIKDYNDTVETVMKNNPNGWFDTTDRSERAKVAAAAERARAATEALHEADKTSGGGRGFAGLIIKALGDDPFPDFSTPFHTGPSGFKAHVGDLKKVIEYNQKDIEGRVRPSTQTQKPKSGKDLP